MGSWWCLGAMSSARIEAFEAMLQSETIDIKTVRNMCHQGIPEKPASLRPLCWMVSVLLCRLLWHGMSCLHAWTVLRVAVTTPSP